MITIDHARDFALALPEAVERDHHGIPSFRVRGKIFATVPDDQHVRIMAEEGDILTAVAEDPAACREFWWGSRLACVVVDLRVVTPELVEELLVDAWRRRAPRRLLDEYDVDTPIATASAHVPASRTIPRPPPSRWTSFLADPEEEKPRILCEQGNPAHRLRVEHNRDTLLVHLSDEDGRGWTVLAVERSTRRWAVAQARRQLDAAEDAYAQLYPGT
jgi:hypothetical protein